MDSWRVMVEGEITVHYKDGEWENPSSNKGPGDYEIPAREEPKKE